MGPSLRFFIIPALFLFLLFREPIPVGGQEFNSEQLSSISRLVETAIQNGQAPGAVVLIGNQGRIVFRQAFGYTTTDPGRAPVTPETLYDIASMTKVVAITPAVLQLEEKGKLRLEDPVVKYWPAFKGNRKERITILQLLTHYSGLPAGMRFKPAWSGYDSALKRIAKEKTFSPPGSSFLYSDLNFIVLGELVQRISGQPLEAYCRENIFRPLGMKNTRYNPQGGLVAPTQAGARGVHDLTARKMGGVAGHAGVFSSVDDLAQLAQMILNGGLSGEKQILSPQTVEKMVLSHSPAGQAPWRGLGWSIHSPSGSQMGELLPPGSFGHKGFTGTLIWIEPLSKTYLIVLTNRVYPGEKEQGETLRDQLLYRVAEILGRPPVLSDPELIAKISPANAPGGLTLPRRRVKPGIDVLASQKFSPLAKKRVGLITNHTGTDSAGRRTIDLLHQAPQVKLKAIFSPEHGLSGKWDGKVPSGRDPAVKVPVFSLYGETLRPTPKMLKGLDVLIFDAQDAGARFYTYISTMGYAMEAASQKGIPFVVLDRPNPISASVVQGAVMDPDLKSFTGYFPLPVRHGMTIGELARMFNSEMSIGARLQVIKMGDYRRSDWFDETGLPWINPSPNLRSLTQAALYPAVALVEGSNVSVGRGTDTPFEIFGAPWIRAKGISEYLNSRRISGVEFQPAGFTPAGSLFKGEVCYGVKILLLDRQALDSGLLGIEIVSALYRLYPKDFLIDKTLGLIGSRRVLQALKEGEDPQSIARSWEKDLDQFRRLRSKYLLYPE